MMPLHGLPAALALEVDALCDDFERHWRRARRRDTALPDPESFVARVCESSRAVLRECLKELERDLMAGVALPSLPGFILEEEIGRGGMGVVYRGRRETDGRIVALKLIPGAEHARWSRWLAELADLHHSNLVPLEGFGDHDGLHFVVMPFVPGGDLKERLSEFVVGPGDRAADRRAATLIAGAADAVAYLHRCGILHRDLKPSNILLSSVNDPEPLVCDFGLAGRLDDEGLKFERTVGTPAYMAPEQRAGQPLTAAADVWGLGAVLHELLIGRPPSSDAVPTYDKDLGQICSRCLRRDARDRYTTMDQLAEDLRLYLTATR